MPYVPSLVMGGNGVSGPTFVDNKEYREYIYREIQARCVDMETAAAAHIAYQNNIPFVFFRSLSDLAEADEDANVMTIFFTLAAKNAFYVTHAVIEALYPLPPEGNVEDKKGDDETSGVLLSAPTFSFCFTARGRNQTNMVVIDSLRLLHYSHSWFDHAVPMFCDLRVAEMLLFVRKNIKTKQSK